MVLAKVSDPLAGLYTFADQGLGCAVTAFVKAGKAHDLIAECERCAAGFVCAAQIDHFH